MSDLDGHMEEEHGSKTSSFEGSFTPEKKEHSNNHHEFKCTMCEHAIESENDLKTHEQAVHKDVKVDIQKSSYSKKPVLIDCDKCKYQCKYNIRLKKHMKSKHIGDYKYKCNFCDFYVNFIVDMYEHRLSEHPESPMEFNSRKFTAKDMILNLLAEQNVEVAQDINEIKTETKGAFEKLSSEIRQCVTDTVKYAFKEINDRLFNLERLKMAENLPSPAAPSFTKRANSPPVSSSGPTSNPPIEPPKSVSRRRKTKFLNKPQILYVGDSIAQKADIAYLERETQSRIRTKKAHSSVGDNGARWPHKNITEVTQEALVDTHEEDKFTHLIISAPTVDITNLNTRELSKNDNIEVYKQKVAISCENVVASAQNAAISHPELDSIVIMEHSPRFDEPRSDPTGIKPRLAEFANNTLATLIEHSGMKDKIILGKHSLDCPPDMVNAWYCDEKTGRYDGVHLYGRRGHWAYTKSVLAILQDMLPSLESRVPSLHKTCPQANYARAQKETQYEKLFHNSRKYTYSVATQNRFSILGN